MPTEPNRESENRTDSNTPSVSTPEQLPTFESILKKEHNLIRQRRRVAFGAASGQHEIDQPEPGENKATSQAGQTPSDSISPEETEQLKDIVGLSLSGGGLRSALFNDGFLRAMSHRGFLRYVDYLSSVSGGGYIAANLMTQAKMKPNDGKDCEDAENFHLDPDPSEDKTAGREPKAWWLGADPENGQQVGEHLPGVGSYLQKTTAGIIGFVRYQVPTMAVYIGLMGCIATLVAIYMRSFDAPLFRALIANEFNGLEGGEIQYAFLPAILCAVLLGVLLIIEAVLRNLQSEPDGSDAPGARRPRTIRTMTGLLAFAAAFFVFAGIAVCLGNSLTTIGRSDSNELHLNWFANYIALVAGGIQILVFLGRDRLFKSEKSEAENWKKVAQTMISYSVVGLAFFAFVHLMACENISHYTQHRDPYFARAEILKWHEIAALHEGYLKAKKKQLPGSSADELSPLHYRLEKYGPASTDYWSRNLLGRAAIGGGVETNDPPLAVQWTTPPGYWAFRGLKVAYCLFPASAVDLPFGLLEEQRNLLRNQREYVAHLNRHALPERDFTDYLIGVLAARQKSDSKSIAFNVLKSEFSIKSPEPLRPFEHHEEWIERRTDGWTQNERGDLRGLLSLHATGTLQDATQRASLNRYLLAAVGPDVTRMRSVVSTPVVQPHDQQARWRWLIVWLCVLSVGLLAAQDLNKITYAFRFYRKQIATHFLRKTRRGRFDANTELSDLKPTEHGLPFPIYQAAWLRPHVVGGTYRIDGENVTCTPLGVHLWSQDAEEAEAAAVSTEPMLLKEAVAVSGAAVTPLMTNNFALSGLLDFFGGRLGKWTRFRTRDDAKKTHFRTETILLAVGASLLLIAFGTLIPFALLASCIAAMVLVAIGIVRETGYPYVITSLLRGQFRGQREFAEGEDTQEGVRQSIEDWPKAFIADGGFYDFLGVSELLRRRCKLIVVSDAGVNSGEHTLSSLAEMCSKAARQLGVQFLDLDHDSPIDFGRLNRDEQRHVAQPYLAMRVKYKRRPGDESKGKPGDKPGDEFGYLFYAQMAITESDPIEIQQIRHCFPSFPDEPTTNQFYTDKQVEAYQHLGYHIGNKLCSGLHRWTASEISDQLPANSVESELEQDRQPLMSEVRSRLVRSFVQACFEEVSYRDNDVFGESIWISDSAKHVYPAWPAAARELGKLSNMNERLHQSQHFWLHQFSNNADVNARYMAAIAKSTNIDFPSIEGYDWLSQTTWSMSGELLNSHFAELNGPACIKTYAAHLTTLAAACQQYHRGMPHAIFQIGGKQKLVNLANSLASDLLNFVVDDGDHEDIQLVSRRFANEILFEVMEMKSCVFHEGDLLATVSFVQCMCFEVVAVFGRIHDFHWPEETSFGSAIATNLLDSVTDFRQRMTEALNARYTSQAGQVIAEYIYSLLCGASFTVSPIVPFAETSIREPAQN